MGADYVSIDPLMPLVLSLSNQNITVKLIFQTRRSMQFISFLKDKSPWWLFIESNLKIDCFESDSKLKLCRKIIRVFKKAFFYLNVKYGKNAICFVPSKSVQSQPFFKLRFHPNIWFYRSGGLYYAGWLDKMQKIYDNPEHRVFLEKTDTITKKDSVVKVRNFLALSNEFLNSTSSNISWANEKILPFPSMQKWWYDYLKTVPNLFTDKRLNEENGFITILLLRKGNYLFEEGSDCDVLLDEIVATIRKVFPGTLIVMKPKIEFINNEIKYWFNEESIRKRYNDNKIIVTYEPITLLSQKTLFAVSTLQSSGNFFFLSNGVPVIEYGRYSKKWTEICPEKTIISEFGGVFIEDINSLESTIRDIENIKVNLDLVKKRIKFRDVPLDINQFKS